MSWEEFVYVLRQKGQDLGCVIYQDKNAVSVVRCILVGKAYGVLVVDIIWEVDLGIVKINWLTLKQKKKKQQQIQNNIQNSKWEFQ